MSLLPPFADGSSMMGTPPVPHQNLSSVVCGILGLAHLGGPSFWCFCGWLSSFWRLVVGRLSLWCCLVLVLIGCCGLVLRSTSQVGLVSCDALSPKCSSTIAQSQLWVGLSYSCCALAAESKPSMGLRGRGHLISWPLLLWCIFSVQWPEPSTTV